MKSLAWGLIGGLLLGLGGCVSQSDVYNLDDRLVVLEQRSARTDKILRTEIQNYQNELSGKDVKQREQFAGLYAGIEGVREDMQRITGRLEEIEHLSREKGSQVEVAFRNRETQLAAIDSQLAALNQRLTRLEQYLNLETPAPAAPTAAPTTGGTPVTPTVEPDTPVTDGELYQRAKAAFDRGQHEQALRDFKALIKNYPKSRNVDNAQFWIGEIYYRDQMYEQAILEYQKVIEQYPKGNKVPASMLKQGLAFYRLGDKPNARLFLNELVGKFPQSPEASIARQKLKNLN